MPHNPAATGTWTTSTRAMSTWIAVHAGALAPYPPCMAPVAPLFHPYRPTRTRQDLPCTSAGEPAPPDAGFDVTGRRAISGPLTPANRGLSRSLTDGLVRRSSSVETRMAQIPKLTVRVRFPSPAPGVVSPAPAVQARPPFRVIFPNPMSSAGATERLGRARLSRSLGSPCYRRRPRRRPRRPAPLSGTSRRLRRLATRPGR